MLIGVIVIGLTACKEKEQSYNTNMTVSVNEERYILDSVFVEINDLGFISSGQGFNNYDELNDIIDSHAFILSLHKGDTFQIIKEKGYQYEYFILSSNNNNDVKKNSIDKMNTDILLANKNSLFMISKMNEKEHFDFSFKIKN